MVWIKDSIITFIVEKYLKYDKFHHEWTYNRKADFLTNATLTGKTPFSVLHAGLVFTVPLKYKNYSWDDYDPTLIGELGFFHLPMSLIPLKVRLELLINKITLHMKMDLDFKKDQLPLADKNGFFDLSEYDVTYLHKSNHLKGVNGWCGYLQEYEKCEALLVQIRLVYDKNYNYIKSKQFDLNKFFNK